MQAPTRVFAQDPPTKYRGAPHSASPRATLGDAVATNRQRRRSLVPGTRARQTQATSALETTEQVAGCIVAYRSCTLSRTKTLGKTSKLCGLFVGECFTEIRRPCKPYTPQEEQFTDSPRGLDKKRPALARVALALRLYAARRPEYATCLPASRWRARRQ